MSRDQHAERAQHVAPDFEVRPFHVQALAAAGLEQPHRDEIDDEARDGHHKHPGRGDRRWRAEPDDRLPQDVGGYDQQ